MPLFEYTGLNSSGKTVKGMREADSQKALRQALRRDGVFLTEVSAASSRGGKEAEESGLGKSWGGGRISANDVAILTQQLATLVGAGIPLVEALTALVDQVEHPRLRRILSQIKQRVNEGSNLADAVGDHPKVFSNLYVNMIRAGESSGTLEIVLNRLAEFTSSQAKLRGKLFGALAYPAVMMIMAVVLIGILFTSVIPKMTQIFDDMEVALPIYTRVLIASSDFASKYWYLVLGFVALSAVVFRTWIKTPKGRARADRTILKVPVFGKLTRLIAMSRFSRTLATLLSSGVQLLVAMEIVQAIVDNTVLKGVLERARDSIREGESISGPLKRSGEFPPMVCHMISVGEKSGQLEEMLHKIADTYDTQVEAQITGLTSVLEPLIIVMMGGGVGFTVAAIIIPILQMNSFVQ